MVHETHDIRKVANHKGQEEEHSRLPFGVIGVQHLQGGRRREVKGTAPAGRRRREVKGTAPAGRRRRESGGTAPAEMGVQQREDRQRGDEVGGGYVGEANGRDASKQGPHNKCYHERR